MLFLTTLKLRFLSILLLVTLISCIAIASSQDESGVKLYNSAINRDNPMDLNSQNALAEYEDYPQNMEFRSNHGLISFLRSGRSGVNGIHRGIRAGNAMWFGPRLGRVQ